jgi:hypothetical protein
MFGMVVIYLPSRIKIGNSSENVWIWTISVSVQNVRNPQKLYIVSIKIPYKLCSEKALHDLNLNSSQCAFGNFRYHVQRYLWNSQESMACWLRAAIRSKAQLAQPSSLLVHFGQFLELTR